MFTTKLASLAVLVAVTAPPAFAQSAPPEPNRAQHRSATLGADGKPTSEELLHRSRGHVWVHMFRREYDVMETWATDARNPARAEADAIPYASLYYSSFWTNMNPYDYEAIKARWLSIFEEWKTKYPKSPTPYLVHGAFLMKRADHIRGEDAFSSLTPDQQLATIAAYDEAFMFLTGDKTNIDLMSADYAWWEMRFKATIKSSVRRKVAYDHLIDGMKRFPNVPSLHTLGAHFNLPKWGGSWEEFNSWVEASVKASQEKYGLEMYARIYMLNYWERPLQKLLRTNPRHWQIVKAGLADIARRQPRLMDHRLFVSMTCGARDQAAFTQYWAAWRANSSTLYEEPPMQEYCAFDEQDDRDAATFEVVPLPKVM